MTGSFLMDLFQGLAANPPVLAGLLFAATLVWEDAAAITGALLAAEEVMPVDLAYAAVAAGIITGDFGLFGLGRWARGNRRVRAWLERWRFGHRVIHHSQDWLSRNLIRVVAFARAFPGLRVPTYFVYGLAGTDFRRFAAVAVIAVLAWIAFVFMLAIHFTAFLERTAELRSSWVAVLVGFVMLIVVLRWMGRSLMRDLTETRS